MFSTSDTIVAIATPSGHGGIGIVRLSGAAAPSIVCAIINRSASSLRPRHATLGTAVDRTTGRPRPIDDVVVTWFQAPKSYTGEDVVEIGAHGSPAILRQLVEAACGNGARLAEPGEFTLRAYLNGRLDLVQAEAVADLVDAVTPLQARTAMDQLHGTLSGVVGNIESALFDLIARLEASLDFPEEGFHFITRETTSAEVAAIARQLEDLAREGRRGRMIRDGAVVALAGRPNAGKSSLFNALVGADRAIVTHLPGTTRDVLTELVDISGVPVTLVDTAGMREAGDAIEAEGVRRARAAHETAQLVILVLDGTAPLTDDDYSLLRNRATPRVVAISKSDAPSDWLKTDISEVDQDAVVVSARTGAGLDGLRSQVVDRLTGREPLQDAPMISNLRHLRHVDSAVEAMGRASRALGMGATEELVLAELAHARAALEAIVGRRSPEDLLRHIFARFCIGK